MEKIKLGWVDAVGALVLGVIVFVLMLFSPGCHTKQKHLERQHSKVEINQVKTWVKTTVIDTTLNVPGSVVSASEPLTQILAGDTLRADNNGTSVEVYYNPKTGNIHAKGKTENRVIPVKATNTESGTEKTGIKAENKEVKKDVTVKPYVWGNIVIGLILTAIVAAFFLFIRWRLKVNGIL
jgi:hypothetical protein